MRQMTSCPRTTPERPRSTRATSRRKSGRVPGRARRVKKPRTRSRVSIRYAASISVIAKRKIARDAVATMSRPMRAISSALVRAYANVRPIASDTRRLKSNASLGFSTCGAVTSHPPRARGTISTPRPTSIAIDPSGIGRATIGGASLGFSIGAGSGCCPASRRARAAGPAPRESTGRAPRPRAPAARDAGRALPRRGAARSARTKSRTEPRTTTYTRRIAAPRGSRARSTRATSGVSTYAMTSARMKGSITARAATTTPIAIAALATRNASRLDGCARVTVGAISATRGSIAGIAARTPRRARLAHRKGAFTPGTSSNCGRSFATSRRGARA